MSGNVTKTCLELPCDQCGSIEFKGVPVHKGRSSRHDRVVCERTGPSGDGRATFPTVPGATGENVHSSISPF